MFKCEFKYNKKKKGEILSEVVHFSITICVDTLKSSLARVRS